MKRYACILLFLAFVFGTVSFDTEARAQELQEYTAHISDPEFQAIVEESMGEIINTRASSRSFSTKVIAGARYTSAYFQVSSGKYITVIATLSLSGKVGIINSTGTIRYVQGTNINHAFKINTTDYYCVFIQNLNSTAITAAGSYAWN